MDGVVRQPVGARDVQPGRLAVQAQPGLIRVEDGRRDHRLLNRRDNVGHSVGALAHHPLQRPVADLAAEHLVQHPPGSLDRQQVLLVQIHRERRHARPVLDRCPDVGWERRARRLPTPGAAPGLGPMLDHPRPHRWEVHHLSSLPVLRWDPRQALPTACTVRGGMLLHLELLPDQKVITKKEKRDATLNPEGKDFVKAVEESTRSSLALSARVGGIGPARHSALRVATKLSASALS